MRKCNAIRLWHFQPPFLPRYLWMECSIVSPLSSRISSVEKENKYQVMIRQWKLKPMMDGDQFFSTQHIQAKFFVALMMLQSYVCIWRNGMILRCPSRSVHGLLLFDECSSSFFVILLGRSSMDVNALYASLLNALNVTYSSAFSLTVEIPCYHCYYYYLHHFYFSAFSIQRGIDFHSTPFEIPYGNSKYFDHNKMNEKGMKRKALTKLTFFSLKKIETLLFLRNERTISCPNGGDEGRSEEHTSEL